MHNTFWAQDKSEYRGSSHPTRQARDISAQLADIP